LGVGNRVVHDFAVLSDSLKIGECENAVASASSPWTASRFKSSIGIIKLPPLPLQPWKNEARSWLTPAGPHTDLRIQIA
jgi:hypothetical protein